MSLRAVQILVPVQSLAALREALDRALRRSTAQPRRILAVLAEGWAALVEPGREGADGGLARLLSELLSTSALAVELDGGALSLRLRKFTQGEPVEGAWEAALRAAPFADVEAIAWRALREQGVPAALRLCGPESVELVESFEGEERGFAALVAEVGEAGPVLVDARALPPERREGDDPPAEPDLWVESKAGEQCALEVRTLAAADVNAFDALAEVEQAQALRLARHLAAHEEVSRLPRISFNYREINFAQLNQARAARPLLARLTEARAPTPLSHAGFTAACRVALEAALPQAKILRAHALRLELAPPGQPGTSLRAPLAQAYDEYLSLPREPQEPAAQLLALVRALLSAPPAPLGELPREAFLRDLLPALASAAGEARATAALAGPLRSALVHDDGRFIAEVPAAALAAHGLTFDEALRRAVENVDALTLGAPEGFSYFDLDQGRVIVFDYQDPAGAARVLSPLSRGLLVDLLAEPCLCVAPARDALLACSMLEEEAIAWVEAEAQRRVAEGPHSLAPDLLVITRDSVAAYGPESELAAAIAAAQLSARDD